MVNYAVDDWTSDVDELSVVVAAMETKLETIDNAKTIRYIDIKKIGQGTFQAVIISDA